MKKIRVCIIVVCVVFILFMVLNSFLDGNESDGLFTKFLKMININNISSSEKLFLRKLIGHFLGYFILGIFILIILKSKPILYFVLGLILSVCTEVIQIYIPSRYFSSNDILLNILGFIMPIFLYNILFYRRLLYEMGDNVGERSIYSFTKSSVLR
jgi:VanZ family protein